MSLIHISGGVLAFARGLGEFGATAMIAGNIAGQTRTLPLAIYSEVAAGNICLLYTSVLVLCFTVAPVSSGVLLSFIIGAVLIILGMGLFTLGVDVSMTPMGNEMGSAITKSRKMGIIILCCFLLGALAVSYTHLDVYKRQPLCKYQ